MMNHVEKERGYLFDMNLGKSCGFGCSAGSDAVCSTCNGSLSDCECDNSFHCWDSTYDMPQHLPYPPAYHGYYYYLPYNYSHVLDAQEHLLSDSAISPFTSTVFEQVYAEFPTGPFNPDGSGMPGDQLIPPAPPKLPNLQDIVNGE